MIPRVLALLLPIVLAASTSTTDGLRAFDDGDHAEAARIFESGGPRDEAALRSYNAGVARLALGEIDEAIARFEEAATGDRGAIRAAALHNLGLAHAARGDARRAEAPEDETREKRIERLMDAAKSYRRSLALFRRVPPPAPDADAGAKAAKVRLMATLDEVRRLEEEARREAEEDALSNPAALILVLQRGERDRRRVAVSLADLDRRRSRRPLRSLRKAESEARQLTEKLAVAIETPPAAPPGAQTAPPPIPEEMRKKAADLVRDAAKAMGEAEARFHGFEPAVARPSQSLAIRMLGLAGMVVASPFPTIVAKLIDDQQSLLQITRAEGSDPVPEEQGDIGMWIEAISEMPDPTVPEGQPATLTPEAVAKIRALASEALDASRRASEHLEAGREAESVPDQEIVLAKLEEIRQLLPKPPKLPAEKIRELIEAEKIVRRGIDGLTGLNDEARATVRSGLETEQRDHGRAAGAVAKELSDSPGEKEKAAAAKVAEAEAEIFDSAESLQRSRDEPAGQAVDRAIERLEEALALLSGEQNQQDGNQDQNRPDPGENENEKDERKQDVRRLDAAEARRLMEEMDRDRREEEEKLFPGGRGMKVDKDW